MSDKTLHHELPGSLGLDILRQSHTTLHGTVDKYAHGSGVREGHVIESLHKHAQGPHQQRRKDIDQADARRVEMHEDLSRQIVHSVLGQQHHRQVNQVAIHHTHQVHETRIAHEARVGMEQPEARNAQQGETDHRSQHLQGVLIECIGLVEDPIHHKATESHNTTVNQKNTPIGQ